MKRLITAVLLLVLTAGLCIASTLWQRTQTGYLLDKLTELEAAFDEIHPEKSLPAAESLLQDFRERTRLYPLFLRHSGISEAEVELLTLPALMQKGEPKDVPAALVRCRAKLETAYETELPKLKNIF